MAPASLDSARRISVMKPSISTFGWEDGKTGMERGSLDKRTAHVTDTHHGVPDAPLAQVPCLQGGVGVGLVKGARLSSTRPIIANSPPGGIYTESFTCRGSGVRLPPPRAASK
jgi:hypothetical protein